MLRSNSSRKTCINLLTSKATQIRVYPSSEDDGYTRNEGNYWSWRRGKTKRNFSRFSELDRLNSFPGVIYPPRLSETNGSNKKGTMENTIGTKLSEARECLELSIEDMSIITRIPSEAIENLETNRFEDFANSIYAESFLKLYCKFLKIDSKILINELRSSLDNNNSRATYLEGAGVSIEFKNFEEEKSKTASPITLAVAITILMIGIPSNVC